MLITQRRTVCGHLSTSQNASRLISKLDCHFGCFNHSRDSSEICWSINSDMPLFDWLIKCHLCILCNSFHLVLFTSFFPLLYCYSYFYLQIINDQRTDQRNLNTPCRLMAFILLLQEATAYFPLVYLFSGICGVAVSKKLEKSIGQKVCIPKVLLEKKSGKKKYWTKMRGYIYANASCWIFCWSPPRFQHLMFPATN